LTQLDLAGFEPWRGPVLAVVFLKWNISGSRQIFTLSIRRAEWLKSGAN
jgi:hypothetical protein